MSRRWLIWTAGIFILACLALLPLQVVLRASDLQAIGFSARQVAGTIWVGRIGELHLREQNLGTFDVRTDPLPLIVGDLSLHFDRLESLEGPLSGRLVAGGKRGVVDVSGRFATGSMFAPLPITALELSDVTVLFAGGKCERAAGQIRPILASVIPGLTLDTGLVGTITCDGERARVRMLSASKQERIEFYINQAGRYRAWITLAGDRGAAAALLSLIGFRSAPEGLILTVEGQW